MASLGNAVDSTVESVAPEALNKGSHAVKATKKGAIEVSRYGTAGLVTLAFITAFGTLGTLLTGPLFWLIAASMFVGIAATFKPDPRDWN